MYNKIRIERVIISLSPFLVYLMLKAADFFNIKSVCLWHFLFGKDCLGCGMGRAIISVLELHFKDALEYNPLVVIVFPLLLFVWLKYLLNSFNTKGHI